MNHRPKVNQQPIRQSPEPKSGALIDVSLPIDNTLPSWPGDPKIAISRVKSVETDGVTLSHLDIGSHTGTHMDAPVHFVAGGKTVDQIDSSRFNGPCRVLDLTNLPGKTISKKDLERFRIRKGERILLKTKNSDYWGDRAFHEDFIGLSTEAAQYLADRKVATVGIDYLSIEPFGSDKAGNPVHKTLLKNEILIIEGLDLRDVKPGDYILRAFPLRLKGADGSPCRAFLEPV